MKNPARSGVGWFQGGSGRFTFQRMVMIDGEVIQNLLPMPCFLWMAMSLGHFDIILDDMFDTRFALGVVNQPAAHFGGDNFRHMLVFGDGRDFLFVQVAQPDAILEAQHDTSPHLDCYPHIPKIKNRTAFNDPDGVVSGSPAVLKILAGSATFRPYLTVGSALS